jgi:ADP-ribose pyrophosphatase YjhB (NUDIX family)
LAARLQSSDGQKKDRGLVASGRAAVVLRDEGRVALVRHVRDGHTYFDFPGGDVRAGEQPADAAVREARDELGVRVVLGPRLLIEELRGETTHYFSAAVVSGDYADDTVWMEIAELPHYDVRPRALATILTGG